MRVLLDGNLPRAFGALLSGHRTDTIHQRRWSDLGHGILVDWGSMHNFLLPMSLVALCAIVVTVWPARRAARANLLPAISGARRGGRFELTFERALVLVQGASAVVLASTALLFVATVVQLTRADGGYRSPDVLLSRVEVRDAFCTGSSFVVDLDRCNGARGQDRQRLARFDELIDALEKIPGVASAALASTAPVIQDAMYLAPLRIGDDAGAPIGTRISVVGAGFFTATGIGLAAGRDFGPADDVARGRVAIISESTARRYFPKASALGRIIEEETRAGLESLRIVGVAYDAKFDPLSGAAGDLRRDEMDMVYLPLAQFSNVPTAMTVIIRTDGDPLRVRPAIAGVLRHAPGIALRQLVPLRRLLEQGSARERLSAALFTGAGGVSLALVAIALFAMLQYSVQRRTREFGIRVALGARRADIVVLVMRDAIIGGAGAVILGLPAAIAAHRMLRAEFFGIAPGDPRVLAAVAAAVIILSASAGLLPAMRAATVAPLDAIRVE